MTDTLDLELEAALRNVFVRDEPGDWAAVQARAAVAASYAACASRRSLPPRCSSSLRRRWE